jgi:hypothetical protein
LIIYSKSLSVNSNTQSEQSIDLQKLQIHSELINMTKTNSQLPLFIFLGIVFWLNAALIIRFCGASVFSEGNPLLPVFFVVAVLITIFTIYVLKLISRLRYDQLLRPLTIMTITATFLDGIAMTWFRTLYSQSFEVSFFGSALILWAVGWGLFFGLILENGNLKFEK